MAIKKRVSKQLNNGADFNKIEDIKNTEIKTYSIQLCKRYRQGLNTKTDISTIEE